MNMRRGIIAWFLLIICFAAMGQADSVSKRIILVGDAGALIDGQASVLESIRRNVKLDTNTVVIFLGDNLYDAGLPDETYTSYSDIKAALDSQINLLRGTQAKGYMIPGNHDWFDANEGFNANFLDRESAVISLRARLYEDLQTDMISNDLKFNAMTEDAKRLREYYGVRNGLQRGPFFEMHTSGFSLIAVDTGILRRVDEKQLAWFEQALVRAGDNYKLVILGHPFYVAGKYVALNEEFREIHELMKRYKVDASMAGDTHDLEHYRETYDLGDGPREMMHFVNGGGGAYLSIGTAVAFPTDPDASRYAFYPRTDDVNQKLDRETPFWKKPFLVWMRTLGGWPFDSEMVSGAFDFNSAPFFQSFLEVRVERSQNRVRFIPFGVHGSLKWSEIQLSPGLRPAITTDEG